MTNDNSKEDQREKEADRSREDPYRRVDYRRLIAWPERIRREAPFLEEILRRAPEKSLLDLGCGTGEHSRFFADNGFRVIGVDRSESMLERAREEMIPENLAFVEGDLRNLSELVESQFGGAISLGNTLVHLTSEESLGEAFQAIADVLLPGGVLLFQILNYHRIFSKSIRYLPLNFSKQDDDETIFLRVMDLEEDGMVNFYPTTLTISKGREAPIQVEESRLVRLRGWKHEQLVRLLSDAGFEEDSLYGDMRGGSFEPERSNDLVVVAEKE